MLGMSDCILRVCNCLIGLKCLIMYINNNNTTTTYLQQHPTSLRFHHTFFMFFMYFIRVHCRHSSRIDFFLHGKCKGFDPYEFLVEFGDDHTSLAYLRWDRRGWIQERYRCCEVGYFMIRLEWVITHGMCGSCVDK